MPFSDIKIVVKDVLMALIGQERVSVRADRNPETLAMLVWGAAVAGLDELVVCPKPVKEIVDDCINAILDHLTAGNLKVVTAAADGLTLYAQNVALLKYLDRGIMESVLAKLVGALSEHLMFQHGTTNKEMRGHIISRLFYCMLEWVMIMPPDLLSTPKVSHLVFEVIESALGVAAAASTTEPDKERPVSPASSRVSRQPRQRASVYEIATSGSGVGGGGNGSPNNISPTAFANRETRRPASMVFDGKHAGEWGEKEEKELAAAANDEEDEVAELIRESAENVLLHILHHSNNFAPPCGAPMLCSQIMDPALAEESASDTGKYLYFAFNSTTIITIVEMPGNTALESRSRLILRDMTGRYTWDTHLFYESLNKMQRIADAARAMVDERGSDSVDGDGEEEGLVPDPDDFDADPCRYLGIAPELTLVDEVLVEDEPRVFEQDKVTYQRNIGDAPVWKEGVGVETADMLDELLQYIGEVHPDCLFKERESLTVPADIPAQKAEAVAKTARALRRQINRERVSDEEFVTRKMREPDAESGTLTPEWDELNVDVDTPPKQESQPDLAGTESTDIVPQLPQYADPPPLPLGLPRRRVSIVTPHDHLLSTAEQPHGRRASVASHSIPHTKGYVQVRPAPHPRSEPQYFRSRLLLSHLGHLHFDGLKDGYFHLLAKTPALFRDIKVLDRKHGREVIKVAILYIAPGQEDEQSVFQNTSGSAEYQAFVSSLGWEIDLTTHPGYLGGLERNAATGTLATYFCTSTLEIIFHDVTKMPTDLNDPKQLKKKRHIGNDHVHVVWNEHFRDYRRNTIGGDFGNAQIVVTPMPDGLYAIEVCRDGKVPTFGPLQNRMTVSKAALGPLVRATAVNAHRAALHPLSAASPTHGSIRAHPQIQQQRHAFGARRDDIRTIANRHKVGKWTFERFVQSVFGTGAEGIVGEVEGNGNSSGAVKTDGGVSGVLPSLPAKLEKGASGALQ
ncbi:Ral GTPase-activating protein subunit alpha-1 [Borealophlyctis nickersoniae]|nr:Ral GTPase-activating protein subunit alpha-1 [Borealophlyctis nickersoniae]